MFVTEMGADGLLFHTAAHRGGIESAFHPPAGPVPEIGREEPTHGVSTSGYVHHGEIRIGGTNDRCPIPVPGNLICQIVSGLPAQPTWSPWMTTGDSIEIAIPTAVVPTKAITNGTSPGSKLFPMKSSLEMDLDRPIFFGQRPGCG